MNLGAGPRVLEGPIPRWPDVDPHTNQVDVRRGSGGKDSLLGLGEEGPRVIWK